MIADGRTTAQLSSAERSIVMDALVRQVGELTRANNKLREVQLFHEERLAQIARRIDEQEEQISALTADSRQHAHELRTNESIGYVFVSRPLLARLRWLLTGR